MTIAANDTPYAAPMIGQEKRLNQGGRGLRRFGGFAGRAAPENVQPKRRHAASDYKTDIPA
jgi:hypothetical protein